MTDYSFQSKQVDVKADNYHGSARVVSTLAQNDLSGGKTQISAGAVVIDNAGQLDIGAGGETTAVGIATQTREVGDARPLTYTRRGLVWAVKDATEIVFGDRLKLGAQGMVTPASDTGGDTNKEIGIAMEASAGAVGTRVLVEMML